MENKPFIYEYRVLMQSRIIGRDYVTLGHNQTVIIDQPFRFQNHSAEEPTLITVELVNKNQSVHFWTQPQ